jgi:hypothetical protein
MDPLTLLLLALNGSAFFTVLVLAVVHVTRRSRYLRAVERLIAEHEGESDQGAAQEVIGRIAVATARYASLSLVTRTRYGWALFYTAALFFTSGAVAGLRATVSADPSQGAPALVFATVCLLLGAVSLLVNDRLLEARRSEYVRRSLAGDEPHERVARDYI